MEELLGCWYEAQRADKVAAHLIRIRAVLDLEYYEPISALAGEVESSSRLLRDLYDLFPIYKSRVGVIVYYLNLLLAPISVTLREMLVFLENDGLTFQKQWTLMLEKLGERGGMTLASTFVMFVEFLVQLVRLLSR